MLNKIKGLFKKKEPGRPLTKKEKILAVVLTLGISLYLVYTFVITPQLAEIEELRVNKAEYTEKFEFINTTIQGEGKVDAELALRKLAKEELTSRYFSEIYQPHIIQVINGLMSNDSFKLESIGFDDSIKEKIGDTEVYSLGVNSTFAGEYEGIIDVIRNINDNYKHIGINGIDLNRDTTGLLTGTMNLKLMSLTGLAEAPPEEHSITDLIPVEGLKPFEAYSGYVVKGEDNSVGPDTEDPNKGETGETTGSTDTPGNNNDNEPTEYVDPRVFKILHDFEDDTAGFLNTSNMSKGRVSRSNIAKSGKSSLRLEYNIVAVDKINRVYADFEDKNIILKYPPQALGMWVRSYGYSPGTLGLRLTGQAGEVVDLEVSKGIGFMDWDYIEVAPPQDLSIYPLKIEKLYFELPFNREDFGVLLVDKLESISEPKVNTSSNKTYTFYVTGPNENLEFINSKFYKGTKMLKELAKLNEIDDYKLPLNEGIIIIVPRN